MANSGLKLRQTPGGLQNDGPDLPAFLRKFLVDDPIINPQQSLGDGVGSSSVGAIDAMLLLQLQTCGLQALISPVIDAVSAAGDLICPDQMATAWTGRAADQAEQHGRDEQHDQQQRRRIGSTLD